MFFSTCILDYCMHLWVVATGISRIHHLLGVTRYCANVPGRRHSPAAPRPGDSAFLQAVDCATAAIIGVSLQLQSEAMQHFNEQNLPLLLSPRLSHVYVFDVHFHVVPLLILFWFVFGERDPYKEKWSTWGREGLYTWKWEELLMH